MKATSRPHTYGSDYSRDRLDELCLRMAPPASTSSAATSSGALEIFKAAVTKVSSSLEAKSQDSDLRSALSCSVCLDLYKTPKNMPNCGHCYCLSCLSGIVARDIFKPKIPCPDCRIESPVGPGGVLEFKTNFQLQKGVEAFRKHMQDVSLSNFDNSAQIANNRCPHTIWLAPESTFHCQHCNNYFCEPCRMQHMELMKLEIINRGKQMDQRVQTAMDHLGDEKVQAIKDAVNENLQEVDASISSVCDFLEAALKSAVVAERNKLNEKAQDLAKFQIEKIQLLIDHFRDNKGLGELTREVGKLLTTSVLLSSLDSMTNLHRNVLAEEAQVVALEKLSSADPKNAAENKIVFTSNEKIQRILLAQLAALNLGSLTESAGH